MLDEMAEVKQEGQELAVQSKTESITAGQHVVAVVALVLTLRAVELLQVVICFRLFQEALLPRLMG
jgi:hypothetical protein